jgi:hypothetical protein
MTSLTVDLAGTINRKVGASAQTLSFLPVLSRDMWKHDIFEISIADEWKIDSGATCRSNKQTNKWNHFNGSHTTDVHNLDCSVTTKDTTLSTWVPQTAYIYGLTNDIDVSSHDDYKHPNLWINAVSTPRADFSESSYSWTVKTVRF